MPEAAAEHSMLRTYLDWLTELPWSHADEEDIDIAKARAILEEDHYGLPKIKRRILEYLAVRKRNPSGKSPILCFVGPPGVGKTSLGQSIARALGLKFVRASLGGVHDEAEIRGHRRTYIGSMPGTVIQSIRKAGTANPVFMLDEMDKLGVGFHGDPSSALLEVLDPEQNSTFRDHYLDVPFDLSKVFFIGTANVLDAIPGPLRDRMEVIELPGYTHEEKLEIAKRYLVQRQLEANGLTAAQASIDDAALGALIDGYTRESGVRGLEREIGSVLRNVAMQITESVTEAVHVDAATLGGILGAPRFESELRMRTSIPGVATGLAWTPVGGDILFIEASSVPGSGRLTLTGQLGDVMKESAQAAVTLIKGRLEELGIDRKYFEEHDLHIHVPAGAIPKDGPSAGVTMFIALMSLFSKRTVRSDIAMTGEISLRGLVLPVGGIKEKVLAAVRAGIQTVLLPARNKKDLEDIPESARSQIEFVWLETIGDAVSAALTQKPVQDKDTRAA
jgi:ATP-dependent Lon protease